MFRDRVQQGPAPYACFTSASGIDITIEGTTFNTVTEDSSKSAPASVTAALEYLTGPARGTVSRLNGSTLDVSLKEPRLVRLTEAGTGSDQVIARLHLAGDTYELEAVGETPIWVNGALEQARRLRHRDLIEFGDSGPLSRFELQREGAPANPLRPAKQVCVPQTVALNMLLQQRGGPFVTNQIPAHIPILALRPIECNAWRAPISQAPGRAGFI